MLLDISPLRRHPEYRLLYTGQMVSYFGTMITYVALPYQVYQLTRSSFSVGIMGAVELIPLLITAFIGGAVADAMDRRKVLIGSEFLLAVASALLIVNSLLPKPHVWLLYVLAAVMSGLNGFHRPSLEAMTPRLVEKEELPAVAALNALRGNLGMIAGPAVGGMIIAAFGVHGAYALDLLSFLVSMFVLAKMKSMPAPEKSEAPSFKSILTGIRYAKSRPELMGTYIVDIVAMTFGMPTALFPAMAESLGGAKVLGWLYSAPSAGALLATLTSGWAKKVNSHGMAVIIAASIWGVAIAAFGFCHNIWFAIFFLVIAGAADMVSGIFRSTIWNETIPDHLRGRLAGVEMLSYTSGPLLGHVEAGAVAALAGTRFSVISGGVLCLIGVGLSAALLPAFRNYRRGARSHQASVHRLV